MDEKQQVLLDVLLLEASLDKLLNDLSLLLLRSALDLDLLEALQGALLDHELLSLLNIQSKRLSFCTLECIFVNLNLLDIFPNDNCLDFRFLEGILLDRDLFSLGLDDNLCYHTALLGIKDTLFPITNTVDRYFFVVLIPGNLKNNGCAALLALIDFTETTVALSPLTVESTTLLT